MKLKFVAAAVIAAAGMSSAMAAADGFWYGLGALGGAYVDSDLHDAVYDAGVDELVSTHSDGYGSVKTDKGTFTGKIALGYQFNDYFALEGGYYYLGKIESKMNATKIGSDSSSDFRAKAKITGHMLGIDAVGMLPLNNVVSLLAKVGAGVVRTKTEWTSEGMVEYDDKASKTKTRLAPKIGVGAEFDINDYISIRTEYEGIFRACNNSNGTVKTDYHLFTVGLKYWF